MQWFFLASAPVSQPWIHKHCHHLNLIQFHLKSTREFSDKSFNNVSKKLQDWWEDEREAADVALCAMMCRQFLQGTVRTHKTTCELRQVYVFVLNLCIYSNFHHLWQLRCWCNGSRLFAGSCCTGRGSGTSGGSNVCVGRLDSHGWPCRHNTASTASAEHRLLSRRWTHKPHSALRLHRNQLDLLLHQRNNTEHYSNHSGRNPYTQIATQISTCLSSKPKNDWRPIVWMPIKSAISECVSKG